MSFFWILLITIFVLALHRWIKHLFEIVGLERAGLLQFKLACRVLSFSSQQQAQSEVQLNVTFVLG